MTRSFFILSMLSVALLARINPFEPVVTSEVITPQQIEPIQIEEKITSIDDGNRTVKIRSDKVEEPVQKEIPLVEKECITEDKNITVVEPIIKPKEPVKLVEKVYKPLPFLSLDLKKDKLQIDSREKYKIIKYFTIPDEKKIVIDFSGYVKHYTKKDSFISQEFDSFVIGNHPDEKFFRVVITTKKHPDEYLPYIKNNLITIYYKKK